jgi:hypothetical protein
MSERDLMSFVYVGRNENWDDFLIPKIGETMQTLNDRRSGIRRDGDPNFEFMGCLILFNLTAAERKYIESYVRLKMEKYAINIKNDHFLIPAMAPKYRDLQYRAFASVALAYAVDCCEQNKFAYILKFF